MSFLSIQSMCHRLYVLESESDFGSGVEVPQKIRTLHPWCHFLTPVKCVKAHWVNRQYDEFVTWPVKLNLTRPTCGCSDSKSKVNVDKTWNSRAFLCEIYWFRIDGHIFRGKISQISEFLRLSGVREKAWRIELNKSSPVGTVHWRGVTIRSGGRRSYSDASWEQVPADLSVRSPYSRCSHPLAPLSVSHTETHSNVQRFEFSAVIILASSPKAD